MGFIIGTTALIFGLCCLGTLFAAERSSRVRRMVKGTPARIDSQPYIVSLQNQDGTHFCAGTIINEQVVLTAAHCILDRKIRVKAGSSYIDSGGTIHQVTGRLTHELYSFNGTDMHHDIALISIEPAITLNNITTKKVELFNVNETVVRDTKAMALGWGATREANENDVVRGSFLGSIAFTFRKYPMDHYYSNHLRRIDLYVVPRAVCQRMFKGTVDKMICAIMHDRSICKGDSGGPLMIQGRQAGVISSCRILNKLGKCSDPDGHAAFTDVGAYREWIDKNVPIIMRPMPKEASWAESLLRPFKRLYHKLVGGDQEANTSARSRLSRVANGPPVNIESYPYVVSIQNTNGIPSCGGTIISENIILTAAHCVESNLQIRAGSSYFDSGGSLHKVIDSVSHKKFDPVNFKNDIGLLKIEPSILLNGLTTQKVKLFMKKNKTNERVNSYAIALGWGATRSPRDGDFDPEDYWDWFKSLFKSYPMDHFQSNQLRSIKLQIFDRICTQFHNDNVENQICAYRLGVNICPGDSGGPLLLGDYQIGISSWSSKECSSPNGLGGYTNVSAYHDWIIEHTKILLEKSKVNSMWECLCGILEDTIIEF
ncbi:hypothetical protein QAD02_004295 [Eretmocerus hayati]|uniref:Uncharacterized protein n=1 Tax=Eretmocerus hayati TaxID=131215 RepID=A0ACC2NPM1_9HYME|nr:hypothetical protein QAD02_004295 [Eretmocerus hayati]